LCSYDVICCRALFAFGINDCWFCCGGRPDMARPSPSPTGAWVVCYRISLRKFHSRLPPPFGVAAFRQSAALFRRAARWRRSAETPLRGHRPVLPAGFIGGSTAAPIARRCGGRGECGYGKDDRRNEQGVELVLHTLSLSWILVSLRWAARHGSPFTYLQQVLWRFVTGFLSESFSGGGEWRFSA